MFLLSFTLFLHVFHLLPNGKICFQSFVIRIQFYCLPRAASPTSVSKPADRAPAMQQASSLSGRSPLIPIEPTTFPSFSIITPPATAATHPPPLHFNPAHKRPDSYTRS